MVFLLCGCARKTNSPIPAEQTVQQSSSECKLLITAVPDSDGNAWVQIPASELNGNLSDGLTYLGVSDVTIELSGETMSLEQAIRDGRISVAEILAYARLDSKNGFCEETYTSKNGLTSFLYCYPDFDVHIIYDVYETPDGQQHLIEDLSIYSTGSHQNMHHYFVDEDSPYGYFIDREDWGLDFDAEEATSTGLTINCTQSGGQQIGELEVDYNYRLYSVAEDQTAPVPGLQGTVNYTPETLPSPIAKIRKDATTRFTIDWTEEYGALESGTYRINLSVKDIFSEAQVHPLMKNYYDSQSYWIEFTIPQA